MSLHSTIACAAILLILLLASGCTDDNASTSPGTNHPPVIRSVTATPSLVSSGWYGEESVLSCAAIDQDGDSLSYRWNCETSSFIDRFNGTEPTVRMFRFKEGENWVRVVVSDGREMDVDSVKVIGGR